MQCEAARHQTDHLSVEMQRNIQEIITQDNDLDSDVGMNLIQLLGGSNDFYGTKRRRSSCTSAASEGSALSGRCACIHILCVVHLHVVYFLQ